MVFLQKQVICVENIPENGIKENLKQRQTGLYIRNKQITEKDFVKK